MKIGGQAVIEGVMMRNQERFAIAVRLPNGKIRVRKEKRPPFPKIFNLFFVRGTIGLLYMLMDGMKALIWSSNQQLTKEEQLTKKEFGFTMAISLIVAVVFFVTIPFFIAHLIQKEGVWFNLLDGVFRVAFFLAYLLIISRIKEVQILFQYHGAEHKTIYCYETTKRASLKAVKSFPKEHHRCGTSFLFLVLIVSILIFSFLTGPWWVKLLGRILLLPVIAGIGYELIKLGDRYHQQWIVKPLLAPGIWLQKITTREPTNKQIQVAIRSLQGVVH